MRFFRFLLPLLIAMHCVVSGAQQVQPKPPSRTDSLTTELERLYGSLRFDDLRDQMAVRLSASAQQSEFSPRSQHFQAKVITQFFVVKAAQEWLNQKVNEEKSELVSKVEGEAHRLETDVEDEFDPHSHDGAVIKAQKAAGKSSAVLGHPDLDKNLWNLSFDSRANYHNGLDVYAHLRLRRDFKTEEWVNSISFDGGWSTDQQWEATFGTQSNHALTETLLFTWNNNFGRKFTEDFMTSSHGPVLAWTLGPQQAISFSASVATKSGSWGGLVEAYGLGIAYRVEVWKERLFISANPSLKFERGRDFAHDAGLAVSLEATL